MTRKTSVVAEVFSLASVADINIWTDIKETIENCEAILSKQTPSDEELKQVKYLLTFSSLLISTWLKNKTILEKDKSLLRKHLAKINKCYYILSDIMNNDKESLPLPKFEPIRTSDPELVSLLNEMGFKNVTMLSADEVKQLEQSVTLEEINAMTVREIAEAEMERKNPLPKFEPIRTSDPELVEILNSIGVQSFLVHNY